MKFKSKFSLLLLSLVVAVLSSSTSASYSPRDYYLINCGSNTNATFYSRQFFADSSSPPPSFLSLSSGNSISLSHTTPQPNTPGIYTTARVFPFFSSTAPGYELTIKEIGLHLVRFHFSPFNSGGYNLSSAVFSLSVNGYLVIHRFTTSTSAVREFILKLDSLKLEIRLLPEDQGSGFAFVNAIEVISAPDDFIPDAGAKTVYSRGFGQYNLSSRVLETVHRINVGGLKLTPFNDTVWRTWLPDDSYLVMKSAAKKVSGDRDPNYQPGGATREIAPDNVYSTAREMNKDELNAFASFNITWNFPVRDQLQYFVRLHFCDIVSMGLNQLYFNVYINGLLAEKDFDLSSLTFRSLASPYYADFVVDGSLNAVQVSVGPSSLSGSLRTNAILNGVEILKIVDSKNTLPGSNRQNNKRVLVGSVLGACVGLLLAVVVVIVALRCKNRKLKRKPTESLGWVSLRTQRGGGSAASRVSERTRSTSSGMNGYNGLKIPIEEIQSATNNFDRTLLIGAGGFGMVYKGVLSDDTKVAVKRGMPGSRQGLPEFHTEISILSKIRHRHLVSLVGYCEEQAEMILVYEYVEKGPLKKHLYGVGVTPLSWKQRLEICIGAARGLHYLHTGFAQGIIHRDIKSTNILLDENYVAKVADFGLSRSGPCLDETHVSTGVKGSFGYLDPEYFRRQQLTDKSDVYSFGVVLFEVLCARPAVDPLLARDQVNLAEHALEWQKRGMLLEIVDPKIRDQIKPRSLKKFGDTAEKCLADYGVDRPTMGDVLWNLEYALQLQENEDGREAEENSRSSSSSSDDHRHGLEASSRDAAASGDCGNERTWVVNGSGHSEDLEVSTSRVFSQLINSRGR